MAHSTQATVLAAAGLWLAASGAHAQEPSVLLAYGGRVVPPMTAPAIPHDAVKPEASAPRWEHALPFMAQRVIDRGIDLPNPYDIGMTAYFGREERVLSSLQVGFNGGALLDASFVKFPRADIDNDSYQVQAGAWIFPFLNAYLIAGKTTSGGEIDIEIAGRDLMGFLGVPGCGLPPAAQPRLCSQTLAGTAHADYYGRTYGVGLTAAGAYKGLFFALPITYVVSDLTISDTRGKTWNVAPRVGWNQHLGAHEFITWYAGATWLKSDVNITGSVDFATEGTVLGRLTSMSFAIHVEPRTAWNALAGVNWTITRNWGVLAEVGFGGTRQDVIVAAFYRF